MFSRTKNETLTRPAPDAATGDVVDALATLLDEQFPPGELPDDSDRALVETICPEIIRAARRLRRQRILNDAAALPIDDFIRDINEAKSKVQSAIASYEKIEQQVEGMKLQQNSHGKSSDASAAAAIEIAELGAKISTLSTWLEDATALRNALDSLYAALNAAGSNIGGLRVHLGHQKRIGCLWGAWGHRSGQLERLGIKARAGAILEVASHAIGTLQSVKSGSFFDQYFRDRYAPNPFGVRSTVAHLAVSFSLPDNDE